MRETRGSVPQTDRANLVVRYDLMIEDGRWKIDDITGTADGQPWSLRRILADEARRRPSR